MNVAVLGASNKPARYSFQAVKLLTEKAHSVFPLHPEFLLQTGRFDPAKSPAGRAEWR